MNLAAAVMKNKPQAPLVHARESKEHSANVFGLSVLRVIALFYLYGAAVHVLNMLSLSGFHWPAAPLKWQILDIVYLIMDIVIAVGLTRRWRISLVLFFIAAGTQILLYSVFRTWILDVPAAYQVSPSDESYLDYLLVFHFTTLAAMAFLMASMRSERSRHDET